MLKGGVSGEDRVVRLNDGAAELRRRVYAEFQLGLLAIVGGKALKEEGTKAGAGTTTERVEDEEALQTGAVVRLPPDLVHNGVDELLTDGIMAASVCWKLW